MSKITLGSAEDIQVREDLKRAISEALQTLWPYLRKERNSDRYKALYDIYESLTVYRGKLQDQQVEAIAGAVTDDVRAISQATSDLQAFLLAVKKVEKVISVLVELVGLIGAVMQGNGKGVVEAIYDLYTAINKKVDAEKEKGDDAAVHITAFDLGSVKMRSLLRMEVKPALSARASVGGGKRAAASKLGARTK